MTALPAAGPPLEITIGATSRDPSWSLADEGTFTFLHPPDLQKQHVRCFDSHCGEYKSHQIELNFDEVIGLGITANDAQRRHDRLAAKFAKNPRPDASTLIRNMNGRYIEISWDHRELRVDAPKPPDAAERRNNYGSYLVVLIRFSNKADLETALQIANSLEFKTKP